MRSLELGPELKVTCDAVELALKRARIGPRGVEVRGALGALHLCLQLLHAQTVGRNRIAQAQTGQIAHSNGTQGKA